MKIIRSFALPTVLSLAALAIGPTMIACSGNVEAAPSATAQSASTRAPIAANAHGPAKMIGEALGDVALRPDQRTQLEQLAKDSEARHAEAIPAHQELANLVASQVEKGQIDRAALQPAMDKLAAIAQKNQAADRAAFEQLHATLDPAQRAQFVDALNARFQHGHGDHEKHGPGPGGPGPDGAREAGGGHGPMGHGGMLAKWADDLKLTDAQKDQIRTAMKAQWEQHKADGGGSGHDHDHAMGGPREHAAKMMEAFKSDHFVLNEVAPPADLQAKARQMSGGILGTIEIILPILTPEQRTIAATKIRAHGEGVHGMPMDGDAE